MASANPQHEPTMEEILASIRKIISEDSSETDPPKQDTDVLELTQEVREEAAPVPPSMAAPQPAPQPIPSYSAPPQPEIESQAPEEDVVFLAQEEPAMSSPAHTTPGNDSAPGEDGIFSEKARRAIDAAFDKIEAEEPAPEPPATPSIPSAGGNAVEAVFERAVRSGMEPAIRDWMDSHRDDLLTAVKPLIREWMDDHFPALLEGAIRDEVARVVKARGRR